MGQKVNPTGLRLGINRTWDSRWYAGKREYGKLLQEDIKIREYLSDKLKAAGVSRIVIERPHKKCRVTIHSARPGVVIGKKGADIEKLKSDVQKYTTDEVHLNIVEIRKPEIDAKLVAENIAQQLERRVAFRRVMKRSVQTAMRLGAIGHPHHLLGPSGRRGNRARGMVSRRPRAAAYAARRHRLRHCYRFHHLWHLRRQGLDLQGRNHGT
jgi:small subunit ribosomal protein S3